MTLIAAGIFLKYLNVILSFTVSLSQDTNLINVVNIRRKQVSMLMLAFGSAYVLNELVSRVTADRTSHVGCRVYFSVF